MTTDTWASVHQCKPENPPHVTAHVMTTHVSDARRRVAVYFSGRVTGCEACFDALWSLFFADPRLEIDFFVALDQDPGVVDPSLHALRERIRDEGQHLAGLHQQRYTDSWRRGITTATQIKTMMELGDPDSPFYNRILHNTGAQFACNAVCSDMIVATGVPYDVVVKFRADALLHEAVWISPTLDPDTVYIPSGRDFHGTCDALAYGDMPSMLAYGDLHAHLAEYLMDEHVFNAEMLIQTHMQGMHLDVKRFPLSWSLERHEKRKGDMSSLGATVGDSSLVFV